MAVEHLESYIEGLILGEDVKIAQKALKLIGFKTLNEEDAVDAYWIEFRVPEKYQHIDCVVKEGYSLKERRIVT